MSLPMQVLQRLAAAPGPRRLGVDRRDLVPGGGQLGEGADGEVGGAEKGQAHGASVRAPALRRHLSPHPHGRRYDGGPDRKLT